MATSDLSSIVEALIYASPEPLNVKALAKLLEAEPLEDIDAALVALKERYAQPGGLQLVEIAGGYQIVTRPELHEWVRRLFHERTSSKLSVAALETLAVIAYRQPVTAPEIAEIRGVNTGGVLNTLVDRKLVKIVGRKAVVGRPFMYGTTKEFLERFGLNDVTDLPRVEDLADMLGFDLTGLGGPEPQNALPFEPSEPSEPVEPGEPVELTEPVEHSEPAESGAPEEGATESGAAGPESGGDDDTNKETDAPREE